MQILNDALDLTAFFAGMAQRARVLLLDYDGTLAPFHVDPQQAAPYPGVRERLDRLMLAGHTRVVLVSGRWTRSLLPLLGLARMPEIWGSHGWEQLKPNGDYAVGRLPDATMRSLLDTDTLVGEIGTAGGRCELKPGGLAIHWRGLAASQVADIRAIVRERCKEQALHEGLVWHDFDGGIELRAPGRTKGFVVDTVLAELADDAAVAYLGDDLTDEDAFRALRGRGIGVLVRPERRPTAADLWLRPPQELLEFLDRWYTAGKGSRRGCA